MSSAGCIEGNDTVRLGRMQVWHPVISLCPRADPRLLLSYSSPGFDAVHTLCECKWPVALWGPRTTYFALDSNKYLCTVILFKTKQDASVLSIPHHIRLSYNFDVLQM